MTSLKPVVIITGGSDGIGRALCHTFGSQGYAVAFTGRTPAKVEATHRSLLDAGIENRGWTLNAASEKDNRELVQRTIDHFGQIDVVICNAGVSMRVLFEELDLKIFSEIMQTNFMGAVSLIKAALPHLIISQGSIIGISSVNGRRATPARTAYAASKYALEGFLESLRMELMSRKVHVMVVCPGFTQSSMRKSAIMKNGERQGETKLNEHKMMPAETVAKRIYRAMLRKRRDLILTTQGKAAVWINKFFPGVMDKIVFRLMAKKPDSPFYKS